MESSPLLGLNDADAAALGEWVLRDRPTGTLLYISMGTGIGATSIQNGAIVPIEFGHLTAFGPKRCGGCGRVGCLDAQIGGHALPTPLDRAVIAMVTDVLCAAVSQQDFVMDRIVIGGGLARRYPEIVSGLIQRIGRTIEVSAAPREFKSAAPIGLLHTWRTR
jgi:predicted NBD/HSP70 family sugar kinase